MADLGPYVSVHRDGVEIVDVADALWNELERDTNIFVPIQWCAQVEILEITRHVVMSAVLVLVLLG